ncbi:MAG: AI-2E family transporter [Mycobacteriales bacterium]
MTDDAPGSPPAPEVARQVEQVREVQGAVEEQAGQAERARTGAIDARHAAEQARAGAEQARGGAEQARGGAEQARAGAVAASSAAVDAAQVVAPPADPLLDTAARRIEAAVDEDNPYGVPGRPLSSRSPFRIAFTGALGIALAYGLVKALIAVQGVLVLLLTAAFLAIGLNPAVEALERRQMRRGFAVGLVLLAMLLFFVGFGFAVVPPIVEQAQEFAARAPGYVAQLQDNERIAAVDERFGLLERAQGMLNDPGRLGVSAAGGVLGVGKVVFGAFFSALTVLIVTLYFLSNLPSIKANAYRLVPRTRRARVGLLTDEILSRVGSYVAGAVTIAALAASLTYLLLRVLGVDYAVALAMVVFLTGLIPLIGATIGAVVITTVALFTSVQAGLIVAVYYLVYQQVENYVLYPRIMQRSVNVSPAATVVAVLVGGSLLGVLGALLAIPIAAAVQLVLQEVVAPRQDAV